MPLSATYLPFATQELKCRNGRRKVEYVGKSNGRSASIAFSHIHEVSDRDASMKGVHPQLR